MAKVKAVALDKFYSESLMRLFFFHVDMIKPCDVCAAVHYFYLVVEASVLCDVLYLLAFVVDAYCDKRLLCVLVVCDDKRVLSVRLERFGIDVFCFSYVVRCVLHRNLYVEYTLHADYEHLCGLVVNLL